jgi:hypothetical protein
MVTSDYPDPRLAASRRRFCVPAGSRPGQGDLDPGLAPIRELHGGGLEMIVRYPGLAGARCLNHALEGGSCPPG